MVFASWRHSTPQLIHASLGLPESKSQTASRSVQPFLHSSPQSVPILYNGPCLPPHNCPFSWEDLNPHPIHGSFGPCTRVLNQNGISIGSAVFARLTNATEVIQTDRQTDRPRCSVYITIGRIYVRSTAKRPKTAEPIDMVFELWTRVGPKKHALDGMHIGATWRIRLNRPCVAAMRPFWQITLTTRCRLVCFSMIV